VGWGGPVGSDEKNWSEDEYTAPTGVNTVPQPQYANYVGVRKNVYGPVLFRLPENRLSENLDFLIIRCLKNPLSEESGVFGNPDYFYWIVCYDCKMTIFPLSPVIAHFDRISLPFSNLRILLVPELCYSIIIVIKHTI
jgi:hypothetical protein